MKANIKNIDLMKVKDNESIYYGFSQEWYKDIWQQRAGCGTGRESRWSGPPGRRPGSRRRRPGA